MDRIYHPYTSWECYQNGMYDSSKDNDIDMISKSVDLLSSIDGIEQAMKFVVENWHHSSQHFLTDLSTNRKAWLGQAACCFEHGASEQATCKAWWKLTDEQRFLANAVADKVISEFENNIVGGNLCLKLD